MGKVLLDPANETTAFDLAIHATMLDAAFEEYRRLWHDDNWHGSVAVFDRERLVTGIVLVVNLETGRSEPRLELWPREITEGNRFACGD